MDRGPLRAPRDPGRMPRRRSAGAGLRLRRQGQAGAGRAGGRVGPAVQPRAFGAPRGVRGDRRLPGRCRPGADAPAAGHGSNRGADLLAAGVRRAAGAAGDVAAVRLLQLLDEEGGLYQGGRSRAVLSARALHGVARSRRSGAARDGGGRARSRGRVDDGRPRAPLRIRGRGRGRRASGRRRVRAVGRGPAMTAAELVAHLRALDVRLWVMDQLSPGGFAYNITGGLRLRGVLNVEALERSLGELVRRHEPLRTVFAATDGQPVQIVREAGAFHLPVRELESKGPAPREAEAGRLMVDEGRRPFDLKTGPLFRAQLLRLAPEEHVLQLTVHHIVADGWSLGVLSKDLTDLYAAAVGASPEIGPPPARYTDLMRRQRQRLTGTTYDAQAAYWRDRFTPPPPVLELPGDHPRPTIQTFDGAIEAFVLPSSLAGALHRLGREQGVTLFMILLAALDVLLHRYTGLDDIAVGTPIANRTDVEAEKVVGLFANTLVLRADLSGDPTVRELLRRVRDV